MPSAGTVQEIRQQANVALVAAPRELHLASGIASRQSRNYRPPNLSGADEITCHTVMTPITTPILSLLFIQNKAFSRPRLSGIAPDGRARIQKRAGISEMKGVLC
jgi:hypothetical protein